MTDTVDVVAFGAHPDDVELAVGGTLLLLKSQGYRTGIVDVTRGELGTRGTPEIRAVEARAAAELLGVDVRLNLGLPDGHVHVDETSRRAVVGALRKLRPTLLLVPVEADLHPDHAATGRLVTESAFLAGVARWDPGAAPHRPRTLLGYCSHTLQAPDVCVDVTPFFGAKKAACLAYASQFHDPGSREPATYISRPEFWDWWEARARGFGHSIGARYGEGFVHAGPVPVVDLVSQFSSYGYYPPSPQIGDSNP